MKDSVQYRVYAIYGFSKGNTFLLEELVEGKWIRNSLTTSRKELEAKYYSIKLKYGTVKSKGSIHK